MLWTSPGSSSVVPAGVTVTSCDTRTLPSWASGRSTVTTAAPGPTTTTPEEVLAVVPVTRSTWPTVPLIGAFSTAASRSCSALASAWVVFSTSIASDAVDCEPPPTPAEEPVPPDPVGAEDPVPEGELEPDAGLWPVDPCAAAVDCCCCSAVAAASRAVLSRSISDAVCWAEVSAAERACTQALTCSAVGSAWSSVVRAAGSTVAVGEPAAGDVAWRVGDAVPTARCSGRRG